MHYACVAVCSGDSGCVLGNENPHVTEHLRVLHPVLLNGAKIQSDCYHPVYVPVLVWFLLIQPLSPPSAPKV